ncbi:hypothetical protein [uncultured Paraglaciecola sp.]|uniref:hypothetical protein n=1 Tax=uncultured Paraglaciecola sp. TaxID=1765024 RepID=UPI00262A92CD|nr:hypothetical protein [uncultured Paraglaciecola sp.]
MPKFKGSLVSATAAVDWHDIKASSALADGIKGEFVIRTDVATRVAIGVANPGTSTSAGIATVAGEAVRCVLGAEAANQNVWVSTPADQSSVGVEVDGGGEDALVVIA